MDITVSFPSEKLLPFALRNHTPAYADDETLLGDPQQAWTWEPIGDLRKEDLAIYASGGKSTSQRTGSSQTDHGEYQ